MSLDSSTVLLIDDDEFVLGALRLLLQRLGCTVVACDGARSALEQIISGTSPDAILCDLKMPELNGIDLMKRLHSRSLRTPFILMSGHADQREIQLAQQEGADAILLKPFSLSDLAIVLSGVIEQAARAHPGSKVAEQA